MADQNVKTYLIEMEISTREFSWLLITNFTPNFKIQNCESNMAD